MDAKELLDSFLVKVEKAVKLSPDGLQSVPAELIPDYPDFSCFNEEINLNTPIFFINGVHLIHLKESFKRFKLEERYHLNLYYCFISFISAVSNIDSPKLSKDSVEAEFILTGEYRKSTLKSISFEKGKKITNPELLYAFQMILNNTDFSTLTNELQDIVFQEKESLRQLNFNNPISGFKNLKSVVFSRYFCIVLNYLLETSSTRCNDYLRISECFINALTLPEKELYDDDKSLYDRAISRLKKDPFLYEKWAKKK